MALSNLPEKVPALTDRKMLVFVHEHASGYDQYPVMVPKDYEAPSGTIGGEQDPEDTPETWAEYQKFADLLGIQFDPERGDEFMWCHDEPISEIKWAEMDDLK